MSQTEPAGPAQAAPGLGGLTAKFPPWLQGAATAATSWFPGMGSAWRGGIVFSALALVAAFLGREGFLFASSMEVVPLTTGGAAPDGIIYYLPKSVIDVQAKFTLLRCDVKPGPDGGPPVVEIDASVSAQTAAGIKSDLSRGYVIRANTMSGGFWNTDMKAELSDGRLMRLGVRQESVAPPRPLPLPSFPQARIMRPEGPELSSELKAVREQVCGKAAIAALAPNSSSADFAVVARSLHLQPGEPCPAGSETIQGPSRVSCVLRGASTIGAALASPAAVSEQLSRYDLIVQLSDIEKAPARSPATGSGIVYRMPGSARLMVCAANCEGANSRVLNEQFIAVPQFGTEAIIPIERRLFSNRTTELEFGTNGELKSIHFVDVATEEKKKDGK